jgi:hypothetical protein
METAVTMLVVEDPLVFDMVEDALLSIAKACGACNETGFAPNETAARRNNDLTFVLGNQEQR